MGKKQYFAEVLGGSKRPDSESKTPQRFQPFNPREEVPELNQDSFDWIDQVYGSPYSSDRIAPYKGKFYEGSPSDPNQSAIKGENQPWLDKFSAGLSGNTLSVITKFVTGVGEVGGGIYDAITNVVPGVARSRKDKHGSYFPHLFENFLTKGLNYVEDDLIKEKLLPVHGGLDYQSDRLLTRMGDIAFWSSDAADAFAFTVSAAIPVGGFTKAAKALGWTKKVVEAGKVTEILTAKGNLFVKLGTASWNTMMEAGLEGKEGLDNIRETLANKYHNTSYEALSKEQKQNINKEAGPLAANIFKANAAALAGPNLIQAAFFVGPVKRASSKLIRGIRAGTIKAEDISYIKNAAAKAGIGIWSEGWEEGTQSAVQNYEKHIVDGTYNLRRDKGYLYEWLNNFNTTEGQEAMLLGAMMGMGYGTRAGILESKQKMKYIQDYGTKYANLLNNVFPASDAEFAQDIKHPYKTFDREITDTDGNKKTIKSIIDENGQVHIDIDKMVKLFNLSNMDKSITDELFIAALNGDEVHEKFILNQALARYAYKYLSNNMFEDVDDAYQTMMDRGVFDKLATDEDIKSLGLDYSYMSDKLSQIKNEWKQVKKNTVDRNDLSATPDYIKFKIQLEKADLYQRMRLSWLNDVESMISDKDEFNKMREDAQGLIDLMEDRTEREKLYDKWTRQNTDDITLDQQYETELKKDPNSITTKKLEYLIHERDVIYGDRTVLDELTISQTFPEMTGPMNMRNKHYFNIGADALVGKRLESTIERVKEGRAQLSEAVNILINPSEGTIDTRGKYDVTDSDVQAVKDLIPGALKDVNDSAYTKEQYDKDVDEVFSRTQIEDENGQVLPREEADLLVKELDDKFQQSEIRRKDLEDSIDILNNIETYNDGRGLLNYKDGLSKLDKEDAKFERLVANEPVEDANNKINIVNANKSAYTKLPVIDRLIATLKDRIDIFTNTELKERLEKPSFNGYMESLTSALSKLENDIRPIVEENFKQNNDIDKNGQINRNKKRFAAIGITVNENNEVVVSDKKIYDHIAGIIGENVLRKILEEAKDAIDVGEEYAFHEVFVDRILTLIKNTRKQNDFIKFLTERYKEKADQFVDVYNATETGLKIGNKLETYKLNPTKIFKDILLSVAGLRQPELIKKTAIDRYKSNNDIYEFRNKLMSEDNTGYDGWSKDQILKIVDRHIELETLQDMIEYLNSDYNLEEQIRNEKAIYAEKSIAPTNQQLNVIRQAVKWYNSPLKKITSTKPESHRFVNWLFIKGVAGSGKTQVVVDFILKSLGVKANEIQMLAPHDKAIEMLSKSTVSTNTPVLISEMQSIPDGIKLVVIDEIAAINNPDLVTLTNKLQEINDNRKDKFRVIVLGDPSQVSAQENTTRMTFDPIINQSTVLGTEHISVTDPLTIRHRSIIPEINEVLDIFDDNYEEVRDITVYASDEVGNESIGIHAGDKQKLLKMLDVHANNGKSKVVVVATELEKQEFQRTRPALKNNVFTFSEIAGTEYDEVYVMFSNDQFKDVIEFNKAYYTAASRAKQYIYLYDKSNTFKSSVKSTMTTDFDGVYRADYDKVLAERKKALELRHSVESDVMKGAVPKKTKTEQVAEIKKEEQSVVEQNHNKPIDDIYEDVESEDLTGNDEDDSTNSIEKIEVADVDSERVHKLKNPSYIGTTFTKKDQSSVKPILNAGSEVIYVKAVDPTKENPFTIHILGQLYSSIDGKPIAGRYAHLGIMSEDEFESDLGIQIFDNITKAYDEETGEALFNVINIDPNSNVVTIKDIPKTIVGRGKLVNAVPLSYDYNIGDSTMSGEGFIDKLMDLINHKLFKRSNDKVDYTIHIFSQKELASSDYTDLAKKKLYAGVPYLLIDRQRKDGTFQKTQFVRLNPINLSSDNNHIIGLRKFYNSILKIQTDINGKAQYGSPEFNKMIMLFKRNYYLNGDNVEFKGKELTWAEYKKHKDVVELTRKEFNAVSKDITPVIQGIYGKGFERTKIKDVSEMISKYHLDKDLKDENYRYEFEPAKDKDNKDKSFGYVIRYELADEKRGGEYVYDTVLYAGAGEAQKHFNVIAKANESINGFKIRVKTLKTRSTAGRFDLGRFVTEAKSLLSSADVSSSYYNQLRRILEENNVKWEKKEVTPQGNEITKTISPWIDEENLEESENYIIQKGYKTREELDKLKADHIKKPVTAQVLQHMVEFDGTHSSLRTPLIMELVNKWGEDITKNKDKIESVLQTNLKDIIPTTVSVQTSANANAFDKTTTSGKEKSTNLINLRRKHKPTISTDKNINPTEKEDPIDHSFFDKFVSKKQTPNNPASDKGQKNKVSVKHIGLYGITEDGILISEKFNSEGRGVFKFVEYDDGTGEIYFDPLTPILERDALSNPDKYLSPYFKYPKYSQVSKIGTPVPTKVKKINGKWQVVELGELSINDQRLLRDRGPVYIGKKITEEDARALIKRYIPNINPKEIVFLEKHLLDIKAGESAWGLYKDGIIYLATNQDGTVYRNVARHEVFHKIFNEYLTEEERAEILKKAKEEFKDFNDYIDLEELLGVKYQNWERGLLDKISDYFKALFIRFKKLINLYHQNIDSIEDLFAKIDAGLIDYRHSNGDNITRLLRDIRRRFGTVNNYLLSTKFIVSQFKRYRNNGVAGIYVTHDEIRKAVLRYTNKLYSDSIIEYRTARDGGDTDLAEYARAKRAFYKRIISNYNDLIADVFPGFNNFSAGAYASKLEEDIRREIVNGRPSVNHGKQILDSVYTNTEKDVTNEVKEFLSYIQDQDGDYLSWRYVYVKMLDMFEGLSFEQNNILGQIEESFKTKELTPNEQAILKYVSDLYKQIDSNISDRGTIISPNYKYITSDLFIAGKESVEHIKHPSDLDIREGKVIAIRKYRNESSTQYASRILKITGLKAEQLGEYSKRQYSTEMFARLTNHFNSHRQRDPKIGERMISYGAYEIKYINARGNAVTNGVKDRLKFIIGEHFSTTEEIDKLRNKLIPEWNGKYRNPLDFVKAFLFEVGLPQYAGTLTSYNAEQIKQDIIHTFDRIAPLVGKPIAKDQESLPSDDDSKILLQEAEAIDVYTTEYLIERYANSFLNHMTMAVSLVDNLSRILSSNDAKNQRRYNATLTSQAHKILYNLKNTKYGKKRVGFNILKVNETHTKSFFKNNIFINGINRIYNVIDDDGLKYDTYNGDQYSVEYRNEKREDFNFRTFVLGYLTQLTTSGEKVNKYIQYIYPNERKTPFGIEVNVLNREQLLGAIEASLVQIKNRDPKLADKYKNFNTNSHLGFEIIDEVIGKRQLTEKNIPKIALDIYNKLDEKSRELASNIVYDRMPFDNDLPLMKKLNGIVDKELYPDYDITRISKNKSGHLKMLETWDDFKKRPENKNIDSHSAYEKGEERAYLIMEEDIQPLVSSFFINNYVNSYHFFQLVAGDFAAFKDTKDLIKRLSIAFAPGRSGFVNDKYGMNRYAKVAVVKDPVAEYQTVRDFITAMLPNASKKELSSILKLFPDDGFKPGDAQGFILQERLEDINLGFGEDYGNVIKGVYYHIEDDGTGRALKYSSIVLSDEICETIDEEGNTILTDLGVLRQKMRNNIQGDKIVPIEEVVFATAVKVGMPIELNNWNELLNPNENITFKEKSTFDIDNKDYRIQLDPEADLDSEVSYPTQLSYLMNLYNENDELADKIYSSLAAIIKENDVQFSSYMSRKSFTDFITETIKKSSQENIYELLSEGIDPNFPSITDKVLIHYISKIFDRIIKTKFEGSKLILQSALGTKKMFESKGLVLETGYPRELEYKTDSDGNLYAECILPRKFLPREVEKEIEASIFNGKEPEDLFYAGFKSKDALGFRIPSSEMHSAVPIKVVGFYDSKGTNVIIAPKLLTVLHGSDFDIDSLFTIRRSYLSSYEKGKMPVGYELRDGKYYFKENTQFIRDIEDDKTKRETTEAYYLNRIIEAFIEATSKPSNRARMLSPISLDELKVEKTRLRQAMGTSEVHYDISNPVHAQQIHDILFSGEAGIGMFMTSFKAFSFLHRANGKVGITELKEKDKIRFNGKSYNKLVDSSEDKLESGYRFDSLANAALDNFKELILPYLNVGKETIRAYSVMVMHGIKFRTINNFITQPILRVYTRYGYRDAGYITRKLNTLFAEDEYKIVDLTDERMEAYLSYKPEDIKELLEKTDRTAGENEFLLFQQAVNKQYNILKTLGQEIARIPRLTNTMRMFPNNVAEMEDIISIAKSMMGIDESESVTDVVNDEKSSFPYYIKDFFKVNTHIYESLRVMENTIEKISSEFDMYSKRIKTIPDKVLANVNVKIDQDPKKNKKRIVDEFNKFLMTSLVSRENIRSRSIQNKKGKEVQLTGLNAFNKDFVDIVLQAQSADYQRRMKSLADPDDVVKYDGNIFLNSLSVKTDWRSGREYVTFYGPSSMDNSDYNLYKESFEHLEYLEYEIKDGRYVLKEREPDGSITNFQRLFVDYAAINYGMSFGLRNYTKVLPGKLYKEISDRYIMLINTVKNLSDTEFNNLVNAFEAQLVLNYPEGALYDKNRIRVGENSVVKHSKIEKNEFGKQTTVNSGVDPFGIHYDRWFEADKERTWPKWHTEKFDNKLTVFRLITDPNGKAAYYVRVGHKHTHSIYDLPSLEIGTKYNEDRAFNVKINGNVIRLAKGVVTKNLYNNPYEKFEEGQVVYISDYNDPGNMNSIPYLIVKKIGNAYYKVEPESRLSASSYAEIENTMYDRVYNEIMTILSKKGSYMHSYHGGLYVQRSSYNKASEVIAKLNKERFNGKKVIYTGQVAPGKLKVFINEQLLRDHLYGKQMDMFRDTYAEAKIINEIKEDKAFDDLSDTLYVIDTTTDQRLQDLSDMYNNKTAEEILTDIEGRINNKFLKTIIKGLKPAMIKLNAEFIGHENLEGNRVGRARSTGVASIDLVKMYNNDYSVAQIDRVVIHEFIHLLTNLNYILRGEFKKQVDNWIQILEATNPNLVKKYRYAFKVDENNDRLEFLADLFSNPEFFTEVNNLNIHGEKMTIVDKIIDYILSWIGLRKSTRMGNTIKRYLSSNVRLLEFIGKGGNYNQNVDIDTYYAIDDYENTEHIKNIINQGLGIENPVTADGNEENFYIDMDGDKYMRTSDIYDGFVGLFRKLFKRQTFGEREANKEWGSLDKTIARRIGNEELTYDQYKEKMDQLAIESSVRGRIIHFMNKLVVDRLYNGGKNEMSIKAEIMNAAYRDYVVTDSNGNKYNVKVSIPADKYEWFIEHIKDIYDVHDINVFRNIDNSLKDVIASEVVVASKELNTAGTIDMLIEHHDGTLSIKDLATGTNFDKFISSRILKYGDQIRLITDSPRDRKKLQIMLYALMVKINNPDVKFRDLSVMWVPNKYKATHYDPTASVEVEDYLEMIKTFLQDKEAVKEAGLSENVYKELLEKSPKLFEASEYTFGYADRMRGITKTENRYQDEIISELLDSKKSPTRIAEEAINELTRIIQQAPVLINLGKNRYTDLDKKDQVKARYLTFKILQLIQDPNVSMNISSDLDISAISGWLGNYSELSIPQIQIWKKFRDEQYYKAAREFDKKQSEHNKYFKPVLDEYYKEHPMLLRNKRYMNFNNYEKMFSWMYKEFDNNGSIQKRLLIPTDEEYKKLNETKRNYVDYLNRHYASYFVGKDAYVNEFASYVPHKGGLRPITIMDLYNKELEGNRQFKYYPGWFPKVPKEQSEMIFEAGEGNYMRGLIDKKFLNQIWVNAKSYYLENNYYGRNHAAMVLPLKHLGSYGIDNSMNYTYNPELQFDQFTNSIEYKKYMDPVYALGEGVRAYLDYQTIGGQPIYDNASGVFEAKLISDVLGRTIRPKLTRKPIRFFGNTDGDKTLRPDALLIMMKNWTSATLMWLKPFTGGGNGINAMLLQHKDSIRGSIGSLKIFGIDGDAIDTTLADSVFADKVYFTEFIPHSIMGKMDQDKTWLLAKKLRYLPDNFDYKSANKYLLSLRNRAVSESTMYAFHRIPEEFVTIVTMISQLKHLKHPTLKDANGKPLSLWECYSVEKDENGNYDAIWKGGTRGKLRVGKGEMERYEDITELTPQEISKLKKTYERMQGGYRKEEASAIEVYVLGKLFMQLKKYYPRLLLNAFGSKRKELDLGYLKKMADKKDGEDVYEWYQRYNEGRFRVLGKFFLSNVFMASKYKDYKWSSMPSELKLHVIDAGLTLGMFITSYAAYNAMFDDDKDDDTLKKWWKMYLIDNFVQQYSPAELLKIGVQSLQPVALTRALQTIQSASAMMLATWELAFGDEAEAFTKDGDFKGWNNFKKSIPLMASYTDFVRRVENSEDLTRILQFEQFSKWR